MKIDLLRTFLDSCTDKDNQWIEKRIYTEEEQEPKNYHYVLHTIDDDLNLTISITLDDKRMSELGLTADRTVDNNTDQNID
jgi:hypothetical protein